MLEYITLHWAEFSAMAGGLMLVGGVIVKLTPTKTDDKWWRVLMSAIGRGKE